MKLNFLVFLRIGLLQKEWHKIHLLQNFFQKKILKSQIFPSTQAKIAITHRQIPCCFLRATIAQRRPKMKVRRFNQSSALRRSDDEGIKADVMLIVDISR